MAIRTAAVATLTIKLPVGERAPGVFDFRENEISCLSGNPEHCYGAVQFGFHPQNPGQISFVLTHRWMMGYQPLKQELPGGKL
jgi:hypothetical protein